MSCLKLILQLKRLFGWLICLWQVAFLGNSVVWAQYHYQFEQAQASNTISHEVIQSITQDGDGYLWLATMSGLNRYDGYAYRTYSFDPQKSGSLSNSYVFKVFVDRKKNLWVGTRQGLNLYNPQQDTFRTFSYQAGNNQQESDVVNDIIEDQAGHIWLATWGGTLVFDPRQQRFVYAYRKGTTQPGLAEDATTALLEDHRGTVWVGAATAGLTLLKNGHFSHFRHQPANPRSLPGDAIRKLYEDRRRQVWVGTNKGLCRYDAVRNDFVRYSFDQTDPVISAIYEDSRGILWVGTPAGLYYLDRQTNQFNLHPQSIELPTKERFGCTAIFEGRDHILWVAQPELRSFDAHKNKFVRYKHDPQQQPRLDINAIRFIYEDSLRQLLFTTARGLSTLPDGASALTVNDQLSSVKAPYTFLQEDGTGGFWVGTQDNGLLQIDRQGQIKAWYKYQINQPQALAGNNIQCMLRDRLGQLWLGTDKGVSCLDTRTGQFRPFMHNHVMKSHFITALQADRQGCIWIATTTGLYVYNPARNQFRAYFNNRKDPHSLSENFVQTLYKDRQGHIWIGTDDGGLNWYDEATGRFIRFDRQTGLASNKIMAITQDHRGNLWLATGKYISRLNPINRQVDNYDVEQHEEYLVFLPNAVCRSRSGMLYFGTVKGVVAFHPDSVQRNMNSPKVLITGFSLFNKPVPIGGPDSLLPQHIRYARDIQIKPGQSVIGFDFIGLSYSSAAKNQYAYKMEGFDTDWNYIGIQRSATYTNLPPGEYVFRVKAANNDGIWNESGASLNVVIQPAFWQTVWFKGGLFLLIVTLGLGIYTMRIRSIERQKVMLEHEVRERTAQVVRQKEEILEKNHQLEEQKREIVNQAAQLHALDQMKLEFFTGVSHEFRTPLTLILGPIQSLIHNQPACKELLKTYQLIYRNADRLLRLINQLMIISRQEVSTVPLRPAQDDLIAFIRSIVESFDYLGVLQHITFTWQAEPDRAEVYFDHDKVEKILYNLLSNAFKYTPAGGQVSLEVRVENEPDNKRQRLHVRVRDTGIGIPAHQLNRIYDRFFQADNSRSQHKEGTGIGLSLVKMLVDLHGGHITTRSEEGKGTDIAIVMPLPNPNQSVLITELTLPNSEITLPREPAEPEDHPEPSVLSGSLTADAHEPAAIYTGQMPSLLLIEDNKEIRDYVKSLFADTYVIDEAADGAEGLHKAQQTIPELIITDIMMPVLDGIQLCQRLKTDDRTSHIPVVMLTARSDVKHEMEGLETGADAYVTKPFHADLLQTRVRKLIQSRRQLRLLFSRSTELIPPKAVPSAVDQRFIERLNEIIEVHLSDPEFGGDVLLREIGMSRTQLYRKIQAVTGQSVNLYIRSIRLKKAAQLLKESEQTVAEVAYEVGFADRSFFSKCFRQQFGMSPKEYAERAVPL